MKFLAPTLWEKELSQKLEQMPTLIVIIIIKISKIFELYIYTSKYFITNYVKRLLS